MEAYRDAWHLKRDPEYGFHYAYVASNQNQFKEAVEAYGTVLALNRDMAKVNPETHLPLVAKTLNNLAGVYRVTQRMTEAEEAYRGGRSPFAATWRKPIPDANLPDVAMPR